jgi:patatin-like phospholipase/acyl hydrolase
MFLLDGGGVRGLTTLLILKRLMYLIQPNDDDYKLPKPCEYFDLIAGTSTGGLIAIMLGRLVSWKLFANAVNSDLSCDRTWTFRHVSTITGNWQKTSSCPGKGICSVVASSITFWVTLLLKPTG